jgi:hypothetical protein
MDRLVKKGKVKMMRVGYRLEPRETEPQVSYIPTKANGYVTRNRISHLTILLARPQNSAPFSFPFVR